MRRIWELLQLNRVRVYKSIGRAECGAYEYFDGKRTLRKESNKERERGT